MTKIDKIISQSTAYATIKCGIGAPLEESYPSSTLADEERPEIIKTGSASRTDAAFRQAGLR
jgi:hypothetical protein